MLDFLMIYFACGTLYCYLFLILHVHDSRNGLRWSKADYIVYPVGFFLPWLCFLLSLYYLIARREDL